jgi:hypothetical protein
MVGVLLSLAPGVMAQTSEKPAGKSDEAMEIVKKAAAALTQVKTVRYKADYKGTKWIASLVPSVRGVATIGSRSKFDIDPFFAEVTITRTTEEGAEKPVQYKAGSDGDIYFLIDDNTKTVYQDMDPLVLGSNSRDIRRVLAPEFADPKPLEDVHKAKSVRLLDSESVDGVSCHVVAVEAERPPVVTYYFSTKDYLPRRVVRTYQNEEGEEATTELILHDVTPNPSFVRSPFKPVVPAGYTKTDEFAP